MPIKEFECQACKHRFEEILLLREPNPVACPKCGAKDLKQLLSTFRVAGLRKKSEDDQGVDEAGGMDEAALGGGGGLEGGDAGESFDDAQEPAAEDSGESSGEEEV
jgi:putative FmdB family regulatory protein